MKQQYKLTLAALFAVTFISACSSDDDIKDDNTDVEIIVETTPSNAVVQTIAPDYTSSELVMVTGDDAQVSTGYQVKDKSDFTVSAYNNEVFHIGRFGIDTIEKFASDNLDVATWSYSTQDDLDTTSRNPYAIAFASDQKAYLLRYGSPTVWIVNPQATQAEDFKIGELDLSAYAENNSAQTPSPSSAVITDGKLFIAMQRIDDSWNAQSAYVAVFDTATDAEIETNASSTDSVMGIPVNGVNPLENSLVAFGDEVFITSRDSYSSFDLSGSMIEAIDTDTFALREVLTASDITDNTAANIKASVVVDADTGFFYVSQSVYEPSYHEVSAVYQFNPTTGEINDQTVAGSGEEAINAIAYDANGYLWIAVGSNTTPGLDILDLETGELYGERLLTDLNPAVIAILED
ncbi:cadherin repeat domain-containing protein [Psychrosphaera sp. B3R10]|uniref:cadherin repeat domain-containing protein n=1 Tax=unclassified Psychrosphaera TaxID=2641570 RepID=UPI001C099AC3|nr:MULTISPECIES: cadherin repeat domain-containing protein [unclassified Psychrosphaera]MBU2880629.1 cadherin repeat domain-containing protein [Psychrosphaera sp. I2R16]MBU2990715.1 cadherin repeat domain-containing protein [Psychrosphaera sp. B3R10]